MTISTGNTFFFTDAERKFPFATLVINDEYDTVSDLGREGVFRLNIGVSKATFRALFGERPALPAADGGGASDFDFTALDRLLPHPVYGRMFWVCVLSPSAATFEEAVKPLLAEAYEQMAGKRQIRQGVKRGRD